MTKTQEIRNKLYCADCKNCKLLVWDTSTKLEKMTNRGYIAEFEHEDDSTSYFLVRCNWLKDNVIEALKLNKCEAKQEVKTTSEAKENEPLEEDEENDFSEEEDIYDY